MLKEIHKHEQDFLFFIFHALIFVHHYHQHYTTTFLDRENPSLLLFFTSMSPTYELVSYRKNQKRKLNVLPAMSSPCSIKNKYKNSKKYVASMYILNKH